MNAEKTKIMDCGIGLGLLHVPSAAPELQKRLLMPLLQALGSQDMQWTEAHERRPKLQVL